NTKMKFLALAVKCAAFGASGPPPFKPADVDKAGYKPSPPIAQHFKKSRRNISSSFNPDRGIRWHREGYGRNSSMPRVAIVPSIWYRAPRHANRSPRNSGRFHIPGL